MKKQSAFTLFELITTLAILAIIASIAAPNLSQLFRNTKVNTSSGELLNFLQQARTEAVKLGKPVTVCASADGINCTTANKTNWSVGLIAKPAGATTPIQKLVFDSSLLSITAPAAIAFNTVGATSDEYEITVTIAGSDTYAVCVEVIGRAFKQKTECPA